MLMLMLTACGDENAAIKPVAEMPAEPRYPAEAQPKLPTVKLWIGAHVMEAEMALTAEQVRTGMMFRTNIDENAGMIFVFPQPHRTAFWMKNCFIPLSAAYIDPDGKILEIIQLKPQNTNAVSASSDNVQFVLETDRGWFERNNITTGTVVRTEQGSLRKTFFRTEQ